MTDLGHEIRKLLDAQQLTQKELSRRSGLHAPTLSNILTGKVKPRVSNLRRITDALKLEPRERERLIALRDGKNKSGTAKSAANSQRHQRAATTNEKSSANQLLTKWRDATRLRRSVRRILEDYGIEFVCDTLVGQSPVEIFLEGRSIAIVCVAMPELTVDGYIDLCQLYRREGYIKKVIFVFEKLDRLSENLDDDLPLEATVTTRAELLKTLRDPSMT